MKVIRLEMLFLALYAGVVVWRMPMLGGVRGIWIAVAAAISVAALYVLVLWFLTSLPRAAQFFGFLGFLPMLAQLTRLPAVIAYVYLERPLGVVLFSALAMAFAWPRLIRRDRHRTVSGQPILTFFDGMNRRKVEDFRHRSFRARAEQKSAPNSTVGERLLMPVIAEAPAGSVRRCTAAALYEILGAVSLKNWLGQAAAIAAIVLFFCYMPGPYYTAPFFVIPALMLAFVRKPATIPPSPLPWDRRGRFVGTLGVTVALTLMAAAALLALTWVSHVLRPAMPVLVVRGQEWSFHALNGKNVLGLLAAAPVAAVVSTLLQRSQLVPMLIGALMVPFSFLWVGPLNMVALPWVALAAAMLWTVFAGVLSYHCFRRDVGRSLY
jgi:hypothetical protein